MKDFINKLKTNKKLRIFFFIVLGLVGVFIFYKLVLGGGSSEEEEANVWAGSSGAGLVYGGGSGGSDSSGADTAMLADVLNSNQQSLADMLGTMTSNLMNFISTSQSLTEENNKTLLESIKSVTGTSSTSEYLNNSGGTTSGGKDWGASFSSLMTQITGYKNQWNSAKSANNSSGMQTAKQQADNIRQRAIEEATKAGYTYNWIDTGVGTKELKVTGGGNTWQL